MSLGAREPLQSHGINAYQAKVQEFAFQAFVGFVVQLVGAAVLLAFYYNIYVLDIYIVALFWALICSIPLFQIKMQMIFAMFKFLNWRWRVKYKVVGVSDEGVLELSDHLEADTSRPPDIHLPAFVMTVEELQRRLRDGEEMYAIVTFQKNEIVTIVSPGHWLGPLQPYTSIGDVFKRDIPLVKRCASSLFWYTVRPLRTFYNGGPQEGTPEGASHLSGSKPYFGLLIRLSVLQLGNNDRGKLIAKVICFVGLYLYMFIVALRLTFTLAAYSAPYGAQVCSRMSRRTFTQEQLLETARVLDSIKVAAKRSGQEIKTLSRTALRWGVARCFDNCHFILSILIMVCAIVGGCYALLVLYVSCKQEGLFLARLFLDNVLTNFVPMVEAIGDSKGEDSSAMTKLIQTTKIAYNKAAVAGSFGGITGAGQVFVGAAISEYQAWLQDNVPDFNILKYLYDSLTGGVANASSWEPPAFVPSWAPAVGDSHDDGGFCAEAEKVGAYCETTASWEHSNWQPPPLEEKFQNTRELVHCLQQWNITGAAGLLPAAYTEIVTSSSVLSGDAVRGDVVTWLAKWTMSGAMGFQQLVGQASSYFWQCIVFLSALYYLLVAPVSCLGVIGDILLVIDQSQRFFTITKSVVRAVLFSALKMAAFHALFTWYLYSWSGVPVVVVPTVVSAFVALFPIIPVISVSIWCVPYLYYRGELACALFAAAANLAVWWQVSTVIYAEIPGTNPWLTGLGVVLGIGRFGPVGVVLGPLMLSIPLVSFDILRSFNFSLAQTFPLLGKQDSSGAPTGNVAPQPSSRSPQRSPLGSPTAKAHITPRAFGRFSAAGSPRPQTLNIDTARHTERPDIVEAGNNKNEKYGNVSDSEEVERQSSEEAQGPLNGGPFGAVMGAVPSEASETAPATSSISTLELLEKQRLSEIFNRVCGPAFSMDGGLPRILSSKDPCVQRQRVSSHVLSRPWPHVSAQPDAERRLQEALARSRKGSGGSGASSSTQVSVKHSPQPPVVAEGEEGTLHVESQPAQEERAPKKKRGKKQLQIPADSSFG